METIYNAVNQICRNYPPLFKAVFILKKNKLFKNTKIKKIANKTLILNTLDYNTFILLTHNKEKILKYIKKTLKDCNCNIEIENVKILNTPELNNQKKSRKDNPVLEKIKQIKEKIYGNK
ncbi:MAG: hypothetical protein ACK4GJ_01510 [bacterium]